MVVSRAGRLFGKRFGREVYNQIGRIFSKKMLERLNVAVTVIVEVVSFVYEAQVWQGQLIERTHKAIEEWRNDVMSDLHEQHLPEIRQANYDIVEALYGDMDMEPPAVADSQKHERLAEVQAGRRKLASLRQQLNSISHP
jgi:hypothetical protein